MKANYFGNCKTIQELKAEYKKLVYMYHPDASGTHDTEDAMKEVNSLYETRHAYILAHPFNEDEKKHNFYANVNDGYREQISKVAFIPGIEIEICGSWIWVTGDTKPVKVVIKEAGYFWSKNKTAWYWRPEGYKSHGKRNWDMNRIRDTYGSQKVEKEERMQVLA